MSQYLTRIKSVVYKVGKNELAFLYERDLINFQVHKIYYVDDGDLYPAVKMQHKHIIIIFKRIKYILCFQQNTNSEAR